MGRWDLGWSTVASSAPHSPRKARRRCASETRSCGIRRPPEGEPALCQRVKPPQGLHERGRRPRPSGSHLRGRRHSCGFVDECSRIWARTRAGFFRGDWSRHMNCWQPRRSGPDGVERESRRGRQRRARYDRGGSGHVEGEGERRGRKDRLHGGNERVDAAALTCRRTSSPAAPGHGYFGRRTSGD